MASIEQRSPNSWRLTVETGYGPNGNRLRERKVVTIEDKTLLKTKKKLQEYLDDEYHKFKQEVQSELYIKPAKMTLNDFVEREWKVKYAEEELSPLTFKTYSHHLKNHVIPSIGHHNIEEIVPMHLVSLMNALSKPGARKDGRGELLSPRTRQYIYDVMRNVFTQAVGWKLIKTNPLDGIKKPKAEKKKASYYESDEAQAVIDALYDEPIMWRIFCLGSILGGFRRGESIALEWTDILFDLGAIHIRKSISLTVAGKAAEKGTKNNEDRKVQMPLWYMEELKSYYSVWKQEKEDVKDKWEGQDRQYLFHRGYGKPLYHTTPSAWWKEFVERHKLKYVSLHSLRHSSATLLIEQGASLKAIQERLGHKQHQTTADIYSHVTKKVSRDLADKFDAFEPARSRQ
jgi:integrase